MKKGIVLKVLAGLVSTAVTVAGVTIPVTISSKQNAADISVTTDEGIQLAEAIIDTAGDAVYENAVADVIIADDVTDKTDVTEQIVADIDTAVVIEQKTDAKAVADNKQQTVTDSVQNSGVSNKQQTTVNNSQTVADNKQQTVTSSTQTVNAQSASNAQNAGNAQNVGNTQNVSNAQTVNAQSASNAQTVNAQNAGNIQTADTQTANNSQSSSSNGKSNGAVDVWGMQSQYDKIMAYRAAEEQKLAAEQAAADKAAEEQRLAAEKAAADKAAEEQRLAAEKAAADKAAEEQRLAVEKAAAEQAAEEQRLAAEKAAAEQAAREEAERFAAEQVTEEPKPIGVGICNCGYHMEIYTYGLSDEEQATWDAHMDEHIAKGEPTNFVDKVYDDWNH